MKKKIPFKLEINNKLISEYEIKNGTFFFNIEQAIKNHLKCEFLIIHENKEIEFLNSLI